MSQMTIEQFRQAMPAFSDSAVFDDPSVQFWLDAADKLLSAERWGDLLSLGRNLFVAHYVTVDALMAKEAGMGGIGGLRGGAITSEGGDSVNVSFDVAGAAEVGAGHWNQTVWGKRYIRLAWLVGAGPVHVGAGSGGDNVSASAWAGPLIGPW